jgi:hypothetical protein
MKIRNADVEPALTAVISLVEMGVDLPTSGALKVRDLLTSLKSRSETISAVQRDIFNKYGVKKEDGSLDITPADAQGRVSVNLIPETKDEAAQKLSELLTTECDVSPALTIADLPERISPRIIIQLGALIETAPDAQGPGPKLVK